MEQLSRFGMMAVWMTDHLEELHYYKKEMDRFCKKHVSLLAL